MRKNENENENSSKVPQIIKTGIKGIQNQATLVTVQTLMPTLNLKKQTNKQIKIQQVRQQMPQHWVDRHIF